MKKIFAAVALLGISYVVQAEDPAENEFVCGDYPGCVLQVRAWDALGAGEHEVAVRFADACARLDEDEARRQQGSLSAKPSDDDVMKYGVLNNVGTCYFIKGEALAKLDKTAEALSAFKAVVNDFSYAKAWDPQGWYWTVADAANESIAKLEK